MPSFPMVSSGDKFQPNARLSNAVRQMVNGADGFKAGQQSRMNANVIRVSCYNDTSSTIDSGTAVMFGDSGTIDSVYPIKTYDGTEGAFWGVLTETLTPDACGSVVVMGCVMVDASGSGNHVTANTDGSFVRTTEGVPIIYADDNGCLILLGGGSGGYTGSFAVTLAENGKLNIGGGWLNCNGFKYLETEETTLDPSNGILCIFSQPIDKKGNWSEPKLEIRATPNQCAYPIAVINVDENDIVTIRQFPVTVATILYSTRCPIAEL